MSRLFARTLRRSIIGSGRRIEIVRVEGRRRGRLTFSALAQSMYCDESFLAQKARSRSSEEKLGIGRRLACLGTLILLSFSAVHITSRDDPYEIASYCEDDE